MDLFTKLQLRIATYPDRDHGGIWNKGSPVIEVEDQGGESAHDIAKDL